MTPVEVVHRAHALRSDGERSRHAEVWEAVSCDGAWTYERQDEPGTPWLVTHVSTGLWTLSPSLPKARRFTARSDAVDFLQQCTRA